MKVDFDAVFSVVTVLLVLGCFVIMILYFKDLHHLIQLGIRGCKP